MPSGETFSGPLSEFVYNDEYSYYQVTPVGWDLAIPLGAESVEFWFETGGAACSTAWDSNYGSNFSFPIEAAPIDAQVGWAGDGGYVISRGMCGSAMEEGIPDTIELDSWALTRAECKWVYIDVYAPGITDQPVQHPEWLEAQAVTSRDGAEAEMGWFAVHGSGWEQLSLSVEHGRRKRLHLHTVGPDRVWLPVLGRTATLGLTTALATRSREVPTWCPTTYWGDEKCP